MATTTKIIADAMLAFSRSTFKVPEKAGMAPSAREQGSDGIPPHVMSKSAYTARFGDLNTPKE